MGALQTIKTEGGEELVVLSRREYEALLARAGDEAAEDAMTQHIVAAARAAATTSTIQPLPLEVWDELEKKDHAEIGPRLRTLRRARSLTQAVLARESGVEQSFISAIESGSKRGSHATQARLAQVLAVSPETLAGRSSAD